MTAPTNDAQAANASDSGDLMVTRLERLLRELRARRVTLTATSRNSLSAHPASAISPELGQELRHFKPEILRALATRNRSDLFVCRGCCAEVVTDPNERCPWCSAVAKRPLGRFMWDDFGVASFCANGPGERAVTRRFEVPENGPKRPNADNVSTSKMIPKLIPASEQYVA